MSAYDWATAGLQDVINLLGVPTINQMADINETGPGAPDDSNPGNLCDTFAALIQQDGLTADAMIYDAIRGGEANVICPLTVGGVPLTNLASTNETRLTVARYSAWMVAKLLNEHRAVTEMSEQAKWDEIIGGWFDQAAAWLTKAREGEAGLLLDRSAGVSPQTSRCGALSVNVGPRRMYPGVPGIGRPAINLPFLPNRGFADW